MDSNKNGQIDFKEFVVACSNLEEVVTKKNIKQIFEIFDLNNDGTISVDELKAVFQGGSLGEEEVN
jgi:calcium-dependent protein kinase